MSTMIPPTVFAQIVQTKSSPETIAASLNEAEALYSDRPKHWNAKRLYPFWRPCPKCGNPFSVENADKYHKKHHCSQACATEAARIKQRGKRVPYGPQKNPRPRTRQIEVTCYQCGRVFITHAAWAKKSERHYCSRSCRAKQVASERDMAAIASLGRAGWTETSMTGYREKMSGPNNPGWKGGVTYFRKHGNYAPIKYVRCPAEFLPMARKDGYVMEHRLIVAQHLGRCLKRSEVVHHVNHDPQDNRLCNLELFASNTAHKKYEATGEPQPLWRL